MATKKTAGKKKSTKKSTTPKKITLKEYQKARNLGRDNADIVANFIKTQRGVSSPKTAQKTISQWDKIVEDMNNERA